MNPQTEGSAVTASSQLKRKRPGPFGPAWALLPKDQQLITLPAETTASSAIERMMDARISQVPIVNDANEIIGAFTWRSFTNRVYDLRDVKLDALNLPIKELLEPALFIEPDVYIDTSTDWGDVDYVIVGDAKQPRGILTISDVFGRLNDFAEAFVLIYEVEHEIRDLIRPVYPGEKLVEQLDKLNLSFQGPTLEVAKQLQDYISENGSNKVLGKSLSILKRSAGRPLESLEDFSFSQYASLICSESNWPDFEPVFDRMRQLVEIDFSKINQLRNVVFHFRRPITVGDTDMLRRFLSKLRDDLALFKRRKADNEAS